MENSPEPDQDPLNVGDSAASDEDNSPAIEITVECEIIELSDEDIQDVKPKNRGRPRSSLPKEAQCLICSKMFGDKHILKKHMLIHTDEKPFICVSCGKAFRHKHSLKSHEFTHQGPDAGRVFTCIECGSSFKRNCTLRTHMKIHSGEREHQCTLCDKSFIQKVNLIQHIKTHNNERNHACDQCDKKFVTASKLKRHYQRHIKKKLKEQGLLEFETKKVVKVQKGKKMSERVESSDDDWGPQSVDDDDENEVDKKEIITVISSREKFTLP